MLAVLQAALLAAWPFAPPGEVCTGTTLGGDIAALRRLASTSASSVARLGIVILEDRGGGTDEALEVEVALAATDA